MARLFRKAFLVSLLASLAGACAPMGQVRKAEESLAAVTAEEENQAQIVKQRQEELRLRQEAVAEAERIAAEAAAKTAAARKELGEARMKDSAEQLKLVDTIIAGAKAQAEAACKFLPADDPRCKDVKSTQPPVAAPKTNEPVHFDIKLTSFEGASAVEKLNGSAPSGWDIEVMPNQFLRVLVPGKSPTIVWKTGTILPACISFKEDGTYRFLTSIDYAVCPTTP